MTRSTSPLCSAEIRSPGSAAFQVMLADGTPSWPATYWAVSMSKPA